MKKGLLVSLVLIAAGVLGFTVLLVSVDMDQAWRLLGEMTFEHIFIYLILVSVNLLLITFRWKVILDSAGVRLPPTRVLANYLAGFAVSHITPFAGLGGEPVRAYLLKAHKVKMDRGMSLVTIDRVIEASLDIVLTILACVLLLWFLAIPAGFSYKTLLAGGAVGIILFAIGLFHFRMFKGLLLFTPVFKLIIRSRGPRRRRAAAWIRSMESHMHRFYRVNKRAYSQALILHMFVYLLKVAEFYVVMLMLQMHAQVFASVAMLAAMGISSAVPIPMAFGTLEGSLVTALGMLGVGSGSAVAAAFIVRFRFSIMSMAGLALLVYFGLTCKTIRDLTNNNKTNNH